MYDELALRKQMGWGFKVVGLDSSNKGEVLKRCMVRTGLGWCRYH